ncbi:hypothetical protein EW026_g7610 [Hermanssonia centrifuga]|uniref:Uncharacterized protein n=1 Tax=Hermanssonia centrifuga TaxID=98765 RepID=A0A4S4K908_9APHY|nr:hypothetical protein EW026_g7610 [Hermanssonia centrifuga]
MSTPQPEKLYINDWGYIISQTELDAERVELNSEIGEVFPLDYPVFDPLRMAYDADGRVHRRTDECSKNAEDSQTCAHTSEPEWIGGLATLVNNQTATRTVSSSQLPNCNDSQRFISDSRSPMLSPPRAITALRAVARVHSTLPRSFSSPTIISRPLCPPTTLSLVTPMDGASKITSSNILSRSRTLPALCTTSLAGISSRQSSMESIVSGLDSPTECSPTDTQSFDKSSYMQEYLGALAGHLTDSQWSTSAYDNSSQSQEQLRF